jgi:hypothetical protein
MKKVFLILSFILASMTVHAQNELEARIEMENAEKAYSEDRFGDALEHLNKTQKLLGRWTGKVSHLKILTLDRLFICEDGECHMTGIYFGGSFYKPDELLAQLEQEVKRYLDYANKNADEVVIDKVREAYDIDKRVKDAKATAARRLAKDDDAKKQWETLKNSTDLGAVQRFLNSSKGTSVEKEAQEHYKSLLNSAARTEWEKIQTTEDRSALQSFISIYAGTTAAVEAQKRYNFLFDKSKIETQLSSLTKDLQRYKNLNSAGNRKAWIGSVCGLGLTGAGAWLCSLKNEDGDTSEVGLILGIASVVGGVCWTFGSLFKLDKYSDEINKLERQIRETQQKLSLSPVVMPTNPYNAGFKSNNMAYGLRLSLRF